MARSAEGDPLNREASDARRGAVLAIGACLFAAYAYFYQAGGWNQNSRFALVRAIVEQHTLHIDDTMRVDGGRVTGDIARYNGHFYSDKAPGLALFAVPPVAIAHPFVADPQSRRGIATLSYLATIVTAGVPGVIAALLVFGLAEKFGATTGGAAFAAAVLGLGSPAWCYSTILYGHALATVALLGAFVAAVALRERSSPRRDWALAMVVGLSGGVATITEYPTVVPAALTSALAIFLAYQRGSAALRRSVAGIAVGALVFVIVLAAMNVASFGAPLTLGYSKVQGFTGMAHGIFGVTYPKRGVLREILFGQFRGLLFLAPVFALAPIGFWWLVRDRPTRVYGLASLAIVLYYLAFNASYYYWDGGWSYGPRHMAPALPFLALALAPLWSHVKSGLRVLLAVVALYGFGLTFVAVSTTAQPPDTYHRPVAQLLWPNFVEGRLSLNHQAFVEDELQDKRDLVAHAWNAGEKIGLTGLWSLVPLLGVWSLIGGTWWTWRKRS